MPNEKMIITKQALKFLIKLKKKNVETTDPSENILLLILVHKPWGHKKLLKEFNISERQAKKAKKLLAQKGILTSLNTKLGKKLPVETGISVQHFFEGGDNSRLMSDMKDIVSVK